MSPSERYDSLLEELRQEFPRLRLVRKQDSSFQRAIHRALQVVTLGQMRGYLDTYQTTIGNTIYLSTDWDERTETDRYVIMRHERIHLRQFDKYGLVVMAILYLVVPLPVGLAWWRAHFEKQAYAESIRAAAAVYGNEYVQSPVYRNAIVSQFTGPAYGWMWPFRRSIERWYQGVL